jgi:hypothetical protein
MRNCGILKVVVLEDKMTFGDRMKELLEQGAAVSKEFAAKAGEKAQDWGGAAYRPPRNLPLRQGLKPRNWGR